MIKWFKRKPEPEPSMTAQEIAALMPKAGEVRKSALEETLYLAPLPVYTGQQAIGLYDFSAVNDVYLQLGGSNKGMVFQGKLLAWAIWMMIIAFFLFPLSLAISYSITAPPGSKNTFASDLFLLLLSSGLVGIFVVPLIIGICIHTLITQTRDQARQYPLRFNRQRREVCFVNSGTHEVLIVPWEKVFAWVSQGQISTQYASMGLYTFGLGLEIPHRGTIQPVLIDKFSQAHAIGTWEAIRQYMEHGIPADITGGDFFGMLRKRTAIELLPYEGMHTWEVERLLMEDLGNLHSCFSDEERLEMGLAPRTRWPLRRWYIWRVLSFWKMPYRIAEWGHKAGTPWMPQQVREWSEPLPPEQWAKPSPELLKANRIIEEAMTRKRRKKNFIDACALSREGEL